MAKIVQTFYISTGAKNVMYTLRCKRGPYADHYIRTLAGSEGKAIEKAREYFEAFCERINYVESDDYVLLFDENPDMVPNARRGRMSARETGYYDALMDGLAPYGKYAGQKLTDLPESYILFFADKFGSCDTDIADAFAAACLGVALELGYITKRDEERQARRNLDLKSQHIGQIGDRIVVEGDLYSCFHRESHFGDYFINKIRVGTDIVTYIGNDLGPKGPIRIKATVKKHEVYNGIASTTVNRPSRIRS